MGVSKNRGTPKSSILMEFSIINHPFWGTPIFGNTHMPFICSEANETMHHDNLSCLVTCKGDCPRVDSFKMGSETEVF